MCFQPEVFLIGLTGSAEPTSDLTKLSQLIEGTQSSQPNYCTEERVNEEMTFQHTEHVQHSL